MKTDLYQLHKAYKKHLPLAKFTPTGIKHRYNDTLYAVTACSCGGIFGWRQLAGENKGHNGAICSDTVREFLKETLPKAPKAIKPALRAHYNRCFAGDIPNWEIED